MFVTNEPGPFSAGISGGFSEINPFEESFRVMRNDSTSSLNSNTDIKISPDKNNNNNTPTNPPNRITRLPSNSYTISSLTSISSTPSSPTSISQPIQISDPHHGLRLLANTEDQKNPNNEGYSEEEDDDEKPSSPSFSDAQTPENEENEDNNENNESQKKRKQNGEEQPPKKRRNDNLTSEEKRKLYLERNKLAATKCRQRKKLWMNEMQEKVQVLGRENSELSIQLARLKNESEMYKEFLFAHKSCSCRKIQTYLEGHFANWPQQITMLDVINNNHENNVE